MYWVESDARLCWTYTQYQNKFTTFENCDIICAVEHNKNDMGESVIEASFITLITGSLLHFLNYSM